MITFLGCIALLVVSYFTYGIYVERVFGPRSERRTPAYTLADEVDYVPMSKPRNSLIQLLNIAGVGPIFGPIMGALYGPAAFVWIVLGAIIAGAVHDYLIGMISVRNRGAHLPELAGQFLGRYYRHIVNAFALLLLVLVGTVFVTAPAALLADLTSRWDWLNVGTWTVIIFIYYVLATMLPVDKIIGRLYPFFGLLLLISGFGVGGAVVVGNYTVPELTLRNLHPEGTPIFPLLFLTISCGALSGFHATQSPIIARTIRNESEGRFIFYGMMIAEAIIAMIWAAASMALLNGQSLAEMLADAGPAGVVRHISLTTLGAIGGTLAVLGVIVLPVTSGDTAFRSARMIIADYIGMGQRKLSKRLAIAVPMFCVAAWLTQIDFNLLWRYFSWANQSTAMIALWIGAVYLAIQRKNHWIAVVPAVFITFTIFGYIFNAEIGFNLAMQSALMMAALATGLIAVGYARIVNTRRKAADAGEPLRLDDGLGDVPLAESPQS